MENIPTGMENKGLSLVEQLFADQYAAQGYTNAGAAYLAIKPHVTKDTAQTEASIILKRAHVQEYLRAKPAASKITKEKLLTDADRITRKAEDKAQFRAALSGIELQGKLINAFDRDEGDESQYMLFLQKVTIGQVNVQINEGRGHSAGGRGPDTMPDRAGGHDRAFPGMIAGESPDTNPEGP